MLLTSRSIYIYIVTGYAIVLSPFVDTGLRNYLALSAALVGVIFFLALTKLVTTQLIVAFILFTLMSLNILLTSPDSKLFSVAFTALYSAGYFVLPGVMRQIKDLRKLTLTLMRNIIFTFAIVSVIQMITSLLNLPVPNIIGSKGLWSYPSLTMEPSHLGRVAGITMLSYLVLSHHDHSRSSVYAFLYNHRSVIIAFLITMLLSGSSLAFMAMILVLIIWHSISYSFILIGLLLLAMPLFSFLNVESMGHSFEFLRSFSTFDVDSLVQIDPSGAVRVIPIILFFQESSPLSIDFWFGGGTKAVEKLVGGRIPGVPDDVIMAGFFPGYIVIYGMIAFCLFIWIFAISLSNRSNVAIIIFWLLFFTTSSWNSQVFWYGLMMIRVVNISLNHTLLRTVEIRS